MYIWHVTNRQGSESRGGLAPLAPHMDQMTHDLDKEDRIDEK